MFGLKIRSWMENHIGRPRKKNNKNKNTNTNTNTNGPTELSTTIASGGNESYIRKNAHANGFSNAGATVNSANVNCSGVISSPGRRREVSPIQNPRHSRYGWHSPDHENISSPKSDNFLFLKQNHIQKPCKNAPVIKCRNENEENALPNLKANCSTSSISSLSWSTGSKEPLTNSVNNKHNRNLHIEQINVATLREERQRTDDQIPLKKESNNYSLTDDSNIAQYEEICTTLRQHEPYGNSSHFVEERPKSEQFNYMSPLQNNSCSSKTKDDSIGRYGKLLPSRLQKSVTGSFDSINTNAGSYPKCMNENYEWTNENYVTQNSFSGGLQPAITSLRTFGGRLNSSNQTAYMGHGNHIGTAVSSPESAYSTGYSTDGTSPVVGGNCNPPEYYINMRTGTHYFPKSINSLTIEAQRYKFGLNKIEEMSPLEPLPKISFAGATGQTGKFNDVTVGCHSPLTARSNSIVLPTLQGFEMSSPRQRCRIRTNPWYSTNENPTAGTINATSSTTQSLISSTLPTFFSNDCTRPESETTTTQHFGSNNTHNDSKSRNDLRRHGKSAVCRSSESCSSSTEVDAIIKTSSVAHFENVTITTELSNHGINRQNSQDVPYSDDEATLNEMMGKFDESYIYEKETDILSDSDPTDCQSDLDTGREAGDECDTDELLDIDFIDTASIQEVLQGHGNNENTGICYYFSNSPVLRSKKSFESKRFDRSRRSFKKIDDAFGETGNAIYAAGATSQRRRKRFLKTRKKSAENKDRFTKYSQTARESRSLGGTPVCLRRNQGIESDHRGFSNSQLSNRSNSLVLSDLYTNRCMMESEKGLLNADMEADVKYRQLILEAESLLVSMKSSLQSIPRETPVSSPRRLNPLANKRVEMLKNSDHESKKSDRVKSQQQQQQQLKDQELVTAINKRIEVLKHEIPKSPASPRVEHKSPRKTHLTNFINQNGPSELIARKPAQIAATGPRPLPPSPQLKLNGRSLKSPKNSPAVRKRRIHYQARVSTVNGNSINSDTDSETEVELEKTKYVNNPNTDDAKNYNYLPEVTRILLYNELDYHNQNIETSASICPQSEPLKRKIYKGSSTFERIKQNLNLDAASPQQSFINAHQGGDGSGVSNQFFNDSNKQHLILSTIADIKRSLETQSIELNGLSCD